MFDFLRDIAPVAVAFGSAAVFGAMLWAGSRVH
jgi:hypothetical protein